jgi:formylglycine-generating enzyme
MVLNDLEIPTKHEPQDWFIRELQDSDATTRWKAVKSVGRLDPGQGASFVPHLIEALSDRSIVVRVAAAEALGRINAAKEEVVTALTTALRDKYASVREAATMALGDAGMGGLSAVEVLREALRDESAYVRKEADRALGKIAARFSGDSLQILLTDLSDPSAERRARAAFVIGKMGQRGRPALDALSRLLDDQAQEVRRTAMEAIETLNFEPASATSGAVAEPPSPGESIFEQTISASDPDSAWEEGSSFGPAFKDRTPGLDESGSSFSTPAFAHSHTLDHGPGKESGSKRWLIPGSLHCGSLGQGLRYERLLRIVVPVPCRLTSNSSLVVVDQEQLSRGPQQILLTIGPMPEDGPFQTSLRLSTPSIERNIDVVFQVGAPPSVGYSPAPQRSIIWQPSHWTQRLAKASARTSGLVRSMAESSTSTSREAWQNEIDSGSSEQRSFSEEHTPGSLELVDTIQPYEATALVSRIPSQAYRVRPTPSARTSALRRSRPPWLAVTSLGFIAVATTVALRLVPRPAISERTNPEIAEISPGLAQPKLVLTKKPEKVAFEAKTVRMPFSLIRSKAFLMGFGEPTDDEKSSDDKVGTPHHVFLTRDYFLAQCEVTREQWNQVMLHEQREGQATAPVDGVSWFDAVRFCNALSDLEGIPPYYRIRDETVLISDPDDQGYRLPTEAEWEFACRSGTKTRWFFGESPKALRDYAFFASNSEEHSHPVGQKFPNAFGLFDTYGNVAEWCWDWYDDRQTVAQNPSGPSTPKGLRDNWCRVLRGGDWGQYESDINSFHRSFAKPRSRNLEFGFRVARNLNSEERKRESKP